MHFSLKNSNKKFFDVDAKISYIADSKISLMSLSHFEEFLNCIFGKMILNALTEKIILMSFDYFKHFLN